MKFIEGIIFGVIGVLFYQKYEKNVSTMQANQQTILNTLLNKLNEINGSKLLDGSNDS